MGRQGILDGAPPARVAGLPRRQDDQAVALPVDNHPSPERILVPRRFEADTDRIERERVVQQDFQQSAAAALALRDDLYAPVTSKRSGRALSTGLPPRAPSPSRA